METEGHGGRGVIVSCDGNRYQVRTYAKSGPPMDVYVEIGACTVIMSTVKVPQLGMQIAFTGRKVTGVTQANMVTIW